MMTLTTRILRLLMIPGLSLLVLTNPTVAEEVRPSIPPVSLKIDAQALGAALNEFAQQSGLQLVFYSKIGKGMTSPRLEGTYSAEAALNELLANTPLEYEFINPRTVAILAKSAVTPVSSTGASHFPLRVAEGSSEQDSSVRLAEQNADIADSNELSAKSTKAAIPEMLVKGSKVINADIERTEDDIQPYVVFSREEIKRSQASTLEEFFRTRLPMVTTQESLNQAGNNNQRGNQSSIGLRGLGPNQTLILVDGRRMPGVSTVRFDGDLSQPDINGIPLAAISRIEVLPSTAGGIYGGSANGGVINIIMRKDYSGIDVGATYGNTFESDVASRRIDMSAGFNFEGGKTQLLFVGSHSDANSLKVGERDFSQRGRELQYLNNPAAFTTGTIPPGGYTPNIRSSSGANLVLDNGTPLNSRYTHVPAGYAGRTSDNGVALVNRGVSITPLSPDDFNNARPLLSTPTVNSGSLDLRRSFSERIDAFVNLRWLDNEGEGSGTTPATITVPGGAPTNPFTSTVRVTIPRFGLVAPTTSESETRQAIGGVIVRLPRDWTAAVDYSWGRSSFFSTSPALVGDPDGSGPGLSFLEAASTGVIDVFRDPNVFPIDYSPYLLPGSMNRSFFGPYETVLRDAGVRISGPTLKMPAGSLQLSASVQRRDEESQDAFDVTRNADTSTETRYYPQASQTVDSYYLEARAPIVSADNALPLLRMLDLQVSVRRDEYETKSNSDVTGVTVPSTNGPFPTPTYATNQIGATKHTIGLRISPIDSLVLRASYGTGFLAPSISQLITRSPFNTTATTVDPKRGGVLTTFTTDIIPGGNPNLDPEDSKSWSAGLIFTPGFLPGLRVSLDYTDIKKSDEIQSLEIQDALTFEDLLNRVRRDPLTSGDAALGYTGGVITAIDTTFINIAKTRLKAYDTQLDYALSTDRSGEFHFYAIGTYQPHLQRQSLPNSSLVEFSGFNSGVLKWRSNAGMTWTKNQVTLGWSAQYYDSYLAYSGGSTPATIALVTLNQGSSTIPSQVYVDAVASYRFADSNTRSTILSDMEITLGIQNLFDRDPPILATISPSGGYSPYADPRLRRYSVSLRKSF